MHSYSTEEIKWLETNAPGRSWKDVAASFNAHFNTDLTEDKIRSVAKRRRIKNGINACFKKDHVPFNKGMKGVNFGGENGKKTQFKKGQRPINYRPVGSERVNVDGYFEVKVADPGKWRLKHQVVWEEHNGLIPKGHAVIFGDGNKSNFGKNNLILITRKQLLTMNKNNLIQKDADLTRTGIMIADIYDKINGLSK